MCYQNWNHTLIGVWNLMMSQGNEGGYFFWIKDPKFHWKCLTWAAGKIIQQVLIPWEHVQSMFAIFLNLSTTGLRKRRETRVISELPTLSSLNALFFEKPTFPGSMAFIVSATSYEFWCISAVLYNKPGKTTACFSRFFGVENNGKGWLWRFFCTTLTSPFVENHGLKTRVLEELI